MSPVFEIMLRANQIVQSSYLIHLIPARVEILLDHMTLKRKLPNIDLGIGVALALPHTAHHVIFGNQTLGLQQDDSQQPLQERIV